MNFSKAADKNDDNARFILGVLRYEKQMDDKGAFNCLQCLANKNNPFACYCCAQMFLHGRGTEKSLDAAAGMYGQVLACNTIDDELRIECTDTLKEAARSNSITGTCEFILAGLHNSVPITELRKYLDTVFDKTNGKHAEYMRYLNSAESHDKLMKAKKENNPLAMLILGKLQADQAATYSKIDKKIKLLQGSFDLIKQAHQSKVASDNDIVSIALCLGFLYSNKSSYDKAKEYFGLAAQLGNMEGKTALASLLMEDTNATAQDIGKALGFFEESALKGNVEHQRILAQLYRSNSTRKGLAIEIKADVGKAYKFITMLLDKKPDDIEGRFIQGSLLGVYGGQDGIPANQTIKAYELVSSAIDHIAHVSSVDYYLLGRLSFANGNYAQALSWFDVQETFQRVPFIGLIMLIEAEKNHNQSDKNKALSYIEQALSEARKSVVVKQVEFCELFLNEQLVHILKQDAETGDLRAGVMLARIVYLFEDGALGISKQTVMSYLLEAAQAGDASAQSFLGFIYYRAQGVARSDETALEYFIKASHQKNIPDFIMHEIMEELVALSNEQVVSPANISAAYYVIPLILQTDMSRKIELITSLIDKAETGLTKHFADNKQLASVFYDSGTWALCKKIADAGDGDLSAALGMVVALRFLHGIIDLSELKNEGFPMLEQALQYASTVLHAADVSKQYFYCISYALTHAQVPHFRNTYTFRTRISVILPMIKLLTHWRVFIVIKSFPMFLNKRALRGQRSY